MSTRDKRKDAIIGNVEREGEGSTRDIARGVGLKVTPYLRALLSELEADGVLQSRMEAMPNGLPVRVFFLA